LLFSKLFRFESAKVIVFSKICNIFAKKNHFFMKKIIGMGNSLTDILLQIEDDSILTALDLKKGSMQLVDAQKMQEISEKLREIPAKMVTGGSASNTVNGIAKIGGKAGFFGKIGADDVGEFFRSDMQKNGATAHLLTSETPSGRCLVLISPDGERTMCTFLGAAAELTPEDISPEIFKDYDVFHIEGYLVQNHDLIRKAVETAKAHNLLVSIDLASFNVVEENLDFLKEIVEKSVDIVFANEEEARAFTQLSPSEALPLIAKLTDIAVVKAGASGSWVKSGEKIHAIPAIKAKAIDTTGAGDSYAAGFLYGLAKSCELDTCGKIGALISGKVVEVIGAKLNDEVWEEIKRNI
jgi:sugar/nucleoside kinase (ribokinase family)